MEVLQYGTFSALTVIIQVIVAIAGLFLVTFLRKLNVKTQLNLDESFLNQIRSIVDDIVISTNQKVVDGLKEKSPNGKLSDEDKKKIYNMVREAVLSCLSQSQLDCLVKNYTDIDDGLSILIERSVYINSNDYIGMVEEIDVE